MEGVICGFGVDANVCPTAGDVTTGLGVGEAVVETGSDVTDIVFGLMTAGNDGVTGCIVFAMFPLADTGPDTELG